jgi:hypothetical protein
VDPAKREALARAKERLDRLDFYPQSVSLRGVRVSIVPLLFRLPWFRRFDGYSAHWTVLLSSRGLLDDTDLVVSSLLAGYDGNPYEDEARRAAAAS